MFPRLYFLSPSDVLEVQTCCAHPALVHRALHLAIPGIIAIDLEERNQVYVDNGLKQNCEHSFINKFVLSLSFPCSYNFVYIAVTEAFEILPSVNRFYLEFVVCIDSSSCFLGVLLLVSPQLPAKRLNLITRSLSKAQRLYFWKV